ncbi:MAG: hypothetical protein FP824_10930 [Euryarchaeota archaeon]|nr:hypothetical protein [Euryarchaeota archaeon]MBU4144126.1 hypothetical protein [Candidatus Thermoplasmatota archaeon]
MSRREDIGRFYNLMGQLERQLGGKRMLNQCNGRMNWPQRGVYFFFEEGELRENGEPRVTRVGTHALKTASKTTLWHRLSTHQGTIGGSRPGGGNHRGSVFRLHVGTAIIERDGLSSETWSVGSSAKRPITDMEYPVEKLVSQHIGRMPFLWVGVDDAPGPESMRGYIERNAIGLLSNYGKSERVDSQSSGWLGNFAKNDKIRLSGLWNVNHVEESYGREFLSELERYVEGM